MTIRVLQPCSQVRLGSYPEIEAQVGYDFVTMFKLEYIQEHSAPWLIFQYGHEMSPPAFKTLSLHAHVFFIVSLEFVQASRKCEKYI
jgi:hypothetical protein